MGPSRRIVSKDPKACVGPLLGFAAARAPTKGLSCRMRSTSAASAVGSSARSVDILGEREMIEQFAETGA